MSLMVWSTWLFSQCLWQNASTCFPFLASSQRLYAALSAMWSEGGMSFARNSAQCVCLACSRLASEKGVASGDRCESVAAIVSTASTPPNRDARSTIFPRRRSQGSRAKHWPMGVATYQVSSLAPQRGAFGGRTPSSTAPVAFSVASAWSMRAAGGGSSAWLKQPGCRPALRIESISSIREQRRISGVGIAWNLRSKRACVKRQKEKPERTRPARPRRCITSALDTNCSFKDDVFVGSW
mmetsp:Transcript_108985/g.308288  ORF Transcript_108985/g.308288 Transcript_108985/m.308288 type:complete len:239 (-) Transcript_108985:351-1067(-)